MGDPHRPLTHRSHTAAAERFVDHFLAPLRLAFREHPGGLDDRDAASCEPAIVAAEAEDDSTPVLPQHGRRADDARGEPS